ncbi:MAG: ABC transporter ATP-binding protein [Lachnospiraceae bacterium]|nr:ABC transporter ATP-binding protein [Lachnospiraceae bacterium]
MIRTLASQVKEYKLPSLLTPLCMILEVIMEMVIPLLMASIIDGGVMKGNIGHIIRIGGVMLVAALIGLLAGIGGGFFAARASTGFAKNLRAAMFENIQTFSFSNIDKFSTSGLVTRLTTDVTNLQNTYQMMLRMMFRAPISLIVAMVMSFRISARLASVYLGAVVILGCILAFMMTRASKYFRAVFRKYDDLNESVQENVAGMRVVKAFVREEYEKTRFDRACINIYDMFVRAEKVVALNGPVMQLAIYSCILLLSWFGAHFVVAGDITTGNLTTLLAYCMAILMNLMMLSMIFVMLTMSAASGERVAAVLNETASLRDPENPVMEVADGSIVFENVSFSYSADSPEPVLRDVNLSIRAGETVGIIGATGSAKTSLVSLISRLYDVTEGRVLVGGVDVRDYDMEVLRNEVSVVLQKNVLFSGTILENLRWGDKDATEEDCVRACRLACADEFIRQLPDGYNTVLTQGGTNVSGGQRQRLCIARALLKKPKILILDDSTSAVDTATDAKIRRAFAEEIPNTTKIIISQRVSSLGSADRIIVMDNGRVSAFDTEENLLAGNEIYREIHEVQTSQGGDFDEKGGEL